MKPRTILCLLLLAASTSQAFAQSTSLQIAGEVGSYIVENTSVSFSTPSSQFSFSPLNNEDWTKGINISLEGDTFYTLSFEPPEGSSFATKQKYTGATRYPFQAATEAGMDVSGDGRGCNELLGNFFIGEIKLSTDKKKLESLAIDFTEQCEKFKPEIIGSLRINSKVPSSLCPAVKLTETREQYILSKNSVLLKSSKLRDVGTVISGSKIGTYKIGRFGFKTKLSQAKKGVSTLQVTVSNGRQIKNITAKDVSRAFIILTGRRAGLYFENSSKMVYKLDTVMNGMTLTLEFYETGTGTLAFCTGKMF